MDAAGRGGGEVETTVREPSQRIGKFAITEQLSHPHIASIIEALIEEKSGYIAVEYVPGGNLSHAVAPNGLLKIEEVFEIAFKCCGALDYAYRQGIVHRDIKPANLMVSEGTAIKIVDFGAALLTNTQHTQIRDVGTPSYMSPEQVRGESLGFASDMFSLGVVLYGMFTGARPFSGQTVPEILMNIVDKAPAQSTLMHEGDKGAGLMFLANGEIKVTKQGRLLNVLRSGSYFGEMAYVKAGAMPRQATVETMTDALIAEFRPAAMRKLSTSCQLQLSLSLLNAVVDRLAFADERIAHA